MTDPTTVLDPPPPARTRGRRWARLITAATALWVLFLIAHLLLTGRWWLWALVEPIPPLLLTAVPVLLLAATALLRPVRRGTALVLVGTLVVGLGLLGFDRTVLTGGTPPAPNAPVLRILSWNTGYWDSGTGYLAERGHDSTAALYDYLAAQRADVYLLSEHLYWNGGPIRLDDESVLHQRFPGYQVNVEGELVTLSRFPVVGRFPRPAGPEPDSWYWHGNKAQRTDISVQGCVFSLYDVHLPQPTDPRLSLTSSRFYSFAHSQYDRVQTELDALRADLRSNPHPLLIAGDFNSPWMGSLIPLGDDVHPQDPTEGSVLPVSFPADDSGWWMPRIWRLDWVFTRGRVDVGQYGFRPSPGLSDHLAQALTVSLPCGTPR